MTGNNISASTTQILDKLGQSTRETTFWYNGLINTIGNLNQGIGFLGKQNANLADSSRTTSTLVGPDRIAYTYDFDEGGRIGKVTSTNGTITTYTYY